MFGDFSDREFSPFLLVGCVVAEGDFCWTDLKLILVFELEMD